MGMVESLLLEELGELDGYRAGWSKEWITHSCFYDGLCVDYRQPISRGLGLKWCIHDSG